MFLDSDSITGFNPLSLFSKGWLVGQSHSSIVIAPQSSVSFCEASLEYPLVDILAARRIGSRCGFYLPDLEVILGEALGLEHPVVGGHDEQERGDLVLVRTGFGYCSC